ncbi:MAG: hypothetical protein ACK4QW_16945 [Alphaproteobacteria bacterium]
MDHASTLTVLHAGFGDLLIQAGIVGVAALWVCVPFAVFGVRRRLEAIADAQRAHAEALTVELRRFAELATRAPAAGVVAPPGQPDQRFEMRSEVRPARARAVSAA